MKRGMIGTLALLVVWGSQANGDSGDAWWNAGWRYRTTISRPGPYRDSGPRPVEAAIDFARLLEKAGVAGRFDPASVRVVEPAAAGPREVPSAWRQEVDARDGRPVPYLAWMADGRAGGLGLLDVYFDTADRKHAPAEGPVGQLAPENLVANGSFEEPQGTLPRGWEIKPAELVSLAAFAGTTGRRSLEIKVDQHTEASLHREVELAQRIDVRAFAGREMVFQCDLLAERAAYGAPVSIELEQYRADGSRIPEFAVEPRWLSIELAAGQLVRLAQRGRFNPEAATVNLRVRVRCYVLEEDSGKRVSGPDSYFTVWLDRFVIRPGERWAWPGVNAGRFVAGAIESAPLNRAFHFTGLRRLAFCGGSTGTLTAGQFNPNLRADHWGPERGTVELWCRPGWNWDDRAEHVFLEGVAIMHRIQSSLRKLGSEGGNQLEFGIADSAENLHRVRAKVPLEKGRWYHLAATWDFPRSLVQLFVDGRAVASLGPESKPWPASPTADGPRELKGMGIVDEDKRSIPMQAYVGGDRSCRPARSAEAVLDEFRVSDVVRYSGDFAPPRAELEADEATRVLFHFENEADGIHAGDDRFVRGHLVCELPPLGERATLEILDRGAVRERRVVVAPHAPESLFEANRTEKRMTVTRPNVRPPDPRYVEYRRASVELPGTQEEKTVDVAGDWEPLMDGVGYELEPGIARARLPVFWANDNVVPSSARSIAETLAPGAGDVRRAMEAFRYVLATTNYYDANYCETLPNGRNNRTAYTLTKALHCYPFNQCGPLNGTLRKLFLCVGVSSTDVSGTHHQFEQAYYQGDWRLFDLSPRLFWLQRDNQTVASRRDLEEDPYLKARQGESILPWMPGRKGRAPFGTAVRPHSMDFEIRAGERIDVSWHNEGKWFELTGNREPLALAKIPPLFGNGRITLDATVASPAVQMENLAAGPEGIRVRDPSRPARLVYRVRSPYILSDARVDGKTEKDAVVRLAVSFDEGKSWQEVPPRSAPDGIAAELGDLVTGRYGYDLKVEIPAGSGTRLAALRVRTVFVCAPLAMPGRLRLGTNRVRLSGDAAAGLNTSCAYTERHRSKTGISPDAISYYLDGDQMHRNVLVARPGERVSKVLIPADAKEGDLKTAEVSGGKTPGRKVPLVVLVADAALVREAERADRKTGEVADVEQPELSGDRAAAFRGRGTLAYDCQAPREGIYALWLRARWEPGGAEEFSLTVDDQRPRQLRANAMIGFTDWTDPNAAHTKMFAFFGEQFGHWSWYRVPDVHLSAGRHRLTLDAGRGTWLDALLVLPATPAVDRAAMNLFQNWNFEP